MYKPINTYTKKDIIWYLKTFNSGKQSYSTAFAGCRYNMGSNHCAIGCFMPHNHKGMKSPKSVRGLLLDNPDLEELMPLKLYALCELQTIHDYSNSRPSSPIEEKYRDIKNAKDRMIQWVIDNVEDV